MPRAVTFFAGACLLLLLGCANTRFVAEWRANDYPGPAFRKLLVVGVTRDGVMRRVFEDQFVAELGRRGVAAAASYTLVPKDGELDRADLEKAVAASGAEGILSTRLVQVVQQTYVYPWPYGYGGPGYGFYGYYPYAYRGAWVGYNYYAYAPPQVVQYNVVVLETQLFNAANQAMVWGATSQTFSPSDPRRDAADLSRLVIDALAAARLIEIEGKPGTR
jgi:hypothetical protein